MKTIIQFNTNTNIESSSVKKEDIVLVFKNSNPIGYVHYDGEFFNLHINYITESFLNQDAFIIEEIRDHFKTLEDLINYYPELEFKVID